MSNLQVACNGRSVFYMDYLFLEPGLAGFFLRFLECM